MNIAYRVAKVAALLFMTVALAVFVSCDLTSEQGDKGDAGGLGQTGQTGPQGPKGDPGTSGQGISALQATGEPMAVVINDKDGAVVGAAKTVELRPYFVGGKDDLTYKLVDDKGKEDGPDDGEGTVTIATLTTGGTAVVVDLEGLVSGNYEDQEFSVEATDADGRSATVEITTRRNKAPVLADPVPTDVLRVGTQSDKVASTANAWIAAVRSTGYECSTYNECEVDLTDWFGTSGSREEDLTFTPTTDSDKVTVKASEKGIIVTGISSTVVEEPAGTFSNGDAQAITIKVAAVDSGGLPTPSSVEIKFNVDGQPTVLRNVPRSLTIELEDDLQPVEKALDVLGGLFQDPEGETLTLAYSSKDEAIATAAEDTAGDNDVIMVTGKAPGSTVITITATEPGAENAQDGIGQFATQTVTVTVVRKQSE
jgi:hypothetical protein